MKVYTTSTHNALKTIGMQEWCTCSGPGVVPVVLLVPVLVASCHGLLVVPTPEFKAVGRSVGGWFLSRLQGEELVVEAGKGRLDADDVGRASLSSKW
eukprot:74099-Amphidinium_carterae.1